MKTNELENLMSRYLLGELPESEQEALEQQFFADQEKFEQVWAAENELIDRYVRGRLSQPERTRFEQHYLATPKHRERVAFAKTLLQAADAASEKERASIIVTQRELTVSWWTKLIEALRGPLMLPVGAMVAVMLMLALGVGWLLSDRWRLSNEIARSRVEEQQREQELLRLKQELERQLAEQRARGTQMSAELERLQEQIRQLEARKPEAGASNQPALMAFLLTPSSVRGSGNIQPLTIPRQAVQVQLQMKLESEDYQSYQVKVRAVDGGEVWEQRSAKARKIKGSPIVTVNVPTDKLTAGDYILTLSGVNAAGQPEEIDRYFFRVTRK